MQVKVLKTWIGTRNKRVGEIINVPDCLAKEWIEGGWVAPVENKLMPPPAENKATVSISGGIPDGMELQESITTVSETIYTPKPRRKIKHRKKAVKK
jgi:hypothetical protein